MEERRGERDFFAASGSLGRDMLKPKRFIGCIWKGKVQLVGTGGNYLELPGII